MCDLLNISHGTGLQKVTETVIPWFKVEKPARSRLSRGRTAVWHSLAIVMSVNKKIRFGFCEYAEGTLEGKEVAISRSGIGKVCTAATAAVMLANFRPGSVINTGRAGGIGAGPNLGDIVLSEQACYHDADIRIFGYKLGQMTGHELYFKATPKLIDAAVQAIKSLKDFTGKVVKGTVLSGDQFISDPAKKEFFQLNFDKAMVAEMEDAAPDRDLMVNFRDPNAKKEIIRSPFQILVLKLSPRSVLTYSATARRRPIKVDRPP